MFGTGKFLGESDFSDSSVQTVYGVWDYGDDKDDSEYLGIVERTDDGSISEIDNYTLGVKTYLLKQELTDFKYTLPNFETVDVRVLTQDKVVWKTKLDEHSGESPNPSGSNTDHVGWYFDLTPRERVVSDVLLRDEKLIIIGFVPDSYQCEPGSGKSWFMEIDAFNGGNLATVQFDTTAGGVINDEDLVRLNPSAELVPPVGIKFRGKLEKASILRFDKSIRLPRQSDDNDGLDKLDDNSSACSEQKYLSSSTGEIRTICEKSIKLGIGYWQEIERDSNNIVTKTQ